MFGKTSKRIMSMALSVLLLGEVLLVSTLCTKVEAAATRSASDFAQKSAEDFALDETNELLGAQDSYAYGEAVLRVSTGESFTAVLNVATAGDYQLALDYYLTRETTQDFLFSVALNGETVNKKATLRSLWRDSVQEYSTDEYGNDIIPASERIYQWQTQAVTDLKTNGKECYSLRQGENEVTITVLQGEALIGKIAAVKAADENDYAAYLKSVPEVYAQVQEQVLEGEKFTSKSRASIRGRRSRNPALVPYDASRLTISTLAGATWATPGDYVTYEFKVEQDGLYHISLKYLLENSGDFPAYKNIYLDDELLFAELRDYYFANTGSRYTNHTLRADGEEAAFYLTAGTHTLKLESTAALFRESYAAITDIVSDMDALALDIKIIRGNQADAARDWDIESFIPDIRTRIETLIAQLEQEYETLCRITGTDELSAASSLLIAADTFSDVLEDRDGLDDMVTGIEQFAQGSGSLAERIVNFLNEMLEQQMSVDRIYITPAAKEVTKVETLLPKADVNFFVSAMEQIHQFFVSVFDEQDETKTLDEKRLNIWVVRSTAHVEEMRQLAVSFTEETGIEVNISSVLDEQKILLALASGDVPDIVCGGSLSKPYDLALRGALTDLSQFEDFEETASSFDPEMFVPFTCDGGIYALPESANPWVTYYRTDIFEELGLPLPETWEEVIELLPVLYANGMSVSTLLANSASLKPMLSMYPYINQNGAELYSEDGTEVRFLDKTFSDAFVSLTELYTKYSLPHTVSSFYVNFRDGISPIGVTDMGTYVLLKNSSPDLEGRWAIADTIGVSLNGKTVSSEMPLIANGCYILKASERQDEAWTFLKWWQSAKVQASYSMNLQLTYGEEILWVPANVEALEIYSPFSEEDLAVVLQRFENIKEIPLHPAHMLVERALSDAWNNAVIDGEAPLTALNNAYITANRDIVKKLKEFGYLDESGRLVREYQIAEAKKQEAQ